MFRLIIFISFVLSQNLFSAPIFWGFGLEGYPILEPRIQELIQQTTLQPQLISFYLQWPKLPQDKQESPTLTLESIWKYGAVPCMTWEPTNIPAEQILNGNYDIYITNMAQTIKSFAKPMMMRFAHEMNLKAYHWGTDKEHYDSHSPETYVKLFKYVVELFKKNQVINALWAFCPNVDSVPPDKWNLVLSYYPGDDYVDLLGMDGYNWGTPSRSFETIFTPIYNQLKKMSSEKPIIVFETATVGSSKEKIQWINEAIATSQKWKLQGIIWFQVNKEKDWRLLPTPNDDLSSIRKATSSSQDRFQLY